MEGLEGFPVVWFGGTGGWGEKGGCAPASPPPPAAPAGVTVVTLTRDGPSGALLRSGHATPETQMEGCAQSRLAFLCGCWGLSVPQGLSPLVTTGACVWGSGCTQAPGARGPRLVFLSFTHSLHEPLQTFVRASSPAARGVTGSQAVSMLRCRTAGDRRGQGPGGDREGVSGRHWDCIHSRRILVMLVPVCPRGQIRPLPVDGQTSQLYVLRDLCPLLQQSGPEGPPRAEDRT